MPLLWLLLLLLRTGVVQREGPRQRRSVFASLGDLLPPPAPMPITDGHSHQRMRLLADHVGLPLRERRTAAGELRHWHCAPRLHRRRRCLMRCLCRTPPAALLRSPPIAAAAGAPRAAAASSLVHAAALSQQQSSAPYTISIALPTIMWLHKKIARRIPLISLKQTSTMTQQLYIINNQHPITESKRNMADFYGHTTPHHSLHTPQTIILTNIF
jgi:hypothetical protein